MIDRRWPSQIRPIADPDLPAIDPPPGDLRLSVVIPARDEADQVEAALEALADQRDVDGKTLDRRSFEVIVLANNCSDATADVVRRFARQVGSRPSIHLVERTFPEDRAHVGTARRWLMDLACARLEAVGRPRGLIASTDADTRVARDWVSESLAEVDSGADAVAGVIQVDPRGLRQLGKAVRRAYWQDRVQRRLLVELESMIDPNPLDVDPRHDFHGGASLAITPRMYRQVGGLPPLPCWEDVALAEALWREDARFVHSPRVRVRTSARQVGRTLGGQSQALDRWSVEGSTIRVRDVRDVEAELVLRRGLRRLFLAKQSQGPSSWRPDPTELDLLGELPDISRNTLVRSMVELTTFGRWLEAVKSPMTSEPLPVERGMMPIDEAIDELRSRLRDLKAQGRH